MAADYAEEHADALADVRESGADVAFSDGVTGAAMRVPGDPKRYAELGLTITEDPTLFFVPDTYGALPEPGTTVSFGGIPYRVKASDPFAPSGQAIFARVMVQR